MLAGLMSAWIRERECRKERPERSWVKIEGRVGRRSANGREEE